MKKIGILLVASTLILSACGKRDNSVEVEPIGFDGDGNALDGTVPDIGAAIGVEYSITMNSFPASLSTSTFGGAGSTDTALVSAIIIDEDNLPVEGLEVAFSSTGGTLKGAQAVTDENGQATVNLSVETDPKNQDIVVSAVSGEDSGEARVVVSGTVIEVVGEDNVVIGSDLNITATMTAGSGEPLANQEVSITSAAGNTLSATTAVTDPLGQIELVAGTANGDDTITFAALADDSGTPSVIAAYEFSVSDDQLTFAADAPTELAVLVDHPVTVNWSFEGNPIVNEDLRFSITSGQVLGGSIATTDADGNASVFVSSTIAGEVVLYVEAMDGSVVNRKNLEFVGVTPAAISIGTSSSRVTTRERAVIAVEVIDANGNPVKDTLVLFSSNNLKGGQISATSATTNADGVAEITFTAGAEGTQADEIAISAQVERSEIAATATLTVVEPALNVIIGSSNLVATSETGTQYSIPYVVQVADGGGQPIAGAEVHISLVTEKFSKGRLVEVDSKNRVESEVPEDETFTEIEWSRRGVTRTCDNEDANGNRFLDAGEDINMNGSLDPQDPALIVPSTELPTTVGGILVTDELGFGHFSIVYPTSVGLWADIKVVARAQALGVESESAYDTRLLVPANAILAGPNGEPPFVNSPYGISSSCADTQ